MYLGLDLDCLTFTVNNGQCFNLIQVNCIAPELLNLLYEVHEIVTYWYGVIILSLVSW